MPKTPTTPASAQAPGKVAKKPQGQARDWEAVERDYRTGRFTMRELEAKHGIPFATIAARAKKEGWTQDLRKVIRQRATAALVNEMVDSALAEQMAAQGTEQAGRAAAQAVQAAAEQAKAVMSAHRTRAHALAATALDLLGELSKAALLAQEQELLAQILAGSGAEPKDEAEARRVVSKALSLGGRASTVKLLTDSLAKVQEMERKAWDLEDDAPPPPPTVDWNSASPEEAMEALKGLLMRAAA